MHIESPCYFFMYLSLSDLTCLIFFLLFQWYIWADYVFFFMSLNMYECAQKIFSTIIHSEVFMFSTIIYSEVFNIFIYTCIALPVYKLVKVYIFFHLWAFDIPISLVPNFLLELKIGHYLVLIRNQLSIYSVACTWKVQNRETRCGGITFYFFF